MFKNVWKWLLLVIVIGLLAVAGAPWQLLLAIAMIGIVAKSPWRLLGRLEETALGERLTRLDIEGGPMIPSDELVKGLDLTEHAVTRFIQRAELEHLSFEEARDLLRTLIGQEGRFDRRPSWAPSTNTADGFLVIGEWLVVIIEHDGSRLVAVTTEVNDPPHWDPEEKRCSWADAFANKWVRTPPPVQGPSGEVDPRTLRAATMAPGWERLRLARRCGLDPSYERDVADARKALLREHGGRPRAVGRLRVTEPLTQLLTIAGMIVILALLAHVF